MLRMRPRRVFRILCRHNPSFLEKLERHELVGGVFYKVKDAPDASSANRAMEKVRAYRA
jgi:hypothetical protein